MANRRLDFSLLKQALGSTTRLSCFVMFILIGSTVFALVFRGVSGDLWVEHLLTGLPGGQTGFLIVVNVMFFLLAFFLDFFELAFILVPLVGPVAHKLGIDLIWFGVLLGVNMQTSFMHPPFGFALFYLRSVAPKEVKTSDIYWGAIPFVCIQVIMVALIIMYPSIVSVEKAVDMEEKLELRIDAPLPEPDAVKGDEDTTPELNFSTDSDANSGDKKPEVKKEEEDTTPVLNFSTDADPKK
jgi:TRAP-type mannitol/chloroaromatic compound transport system permease large subunit